jgi:opacity protein-like surface antigen
MHRRAIGIALVCLSGWPLTAAAAQCEEAPRARAAVLGAATVNSGDTAAAIAGSFGYRVDRCFGLEFEIGVIPDLQDDPQVIPLGSVSFSSFSFGPSDGRSVPVPTIFPPPEFDNRLITFMTNARVEIPTTLRAIVPYVVGGGGIASLRRDVTYGPYLALQQGRPGSTVPITILPRSSSSTETALALNVGAGVSIRIVKELFADADMRYVRVFANDELDLNRFGAGISYRF